MIPNTHLVLRGGGGETNYHPTEIQAASKKLQDAGLPENIMVDCSHANSEKVPARQAHVWSSLLEQRKLPGSPIIGAMLESFIEEGSQPIRNDLTYGLSITDPCMSWVAANSLLRTTFL